MVVRFIDGGKRRIWRKPPTCRKSLTNDRSVKYCATSVYQRCARFDNVYTHVGRGCIHKVPNTLYFFKSPITCSTRILYSETSPLNFLHFLFMCSGFRFICCVVNPVTVGCRFGKILSVKSTQSSGKCSGPFTPSCFIIVICCASF